MLTITMQEFVNAIHEGIINEPITLIRTLLGVDQESVTILDENDSTYNSEKVDIAINALVDMFTYQNPTNELVYLSRSTEGKLEARSGSYLFAVTPLLMKDSMEFTILAYNGRNEEEGHKLSLLEAVDFINDLCGTFRVNKQDIIEALINEVWTGNDDYEGVINIGYGGYDVDIWYTVI